MTMTKIKMTMLAVVALALAIALPAFAQDTTQPSTPANPSTGQQTDQSGSQPMQQPDNECSGANADRIREPP